MHCTAGKDRTGVLVALVLDVLGVGEKEIVADYLISNERLSADPGDMIFQHLISEDLIPGRWRTCARGTGAPRGTCWRTG